MEIVLTNRAPDILANVRAALAAATVAGNSVFSSVVAVDDPRSFVRVTDVLKGPNEADAGVVDAQPERRDGTIDVEKSIYRMSTDIIVRFNVAPDRKAGGDEMAVVDKARRYVEVVRAALMSDPSRGGKANLIQFAGQVINGTEVSGRPRLMAAAENTAFRSVLIPASFGWADFV